jgi:hypothetical protein
MDKKQYKAPQLTPYGSIEKCTFTSPGNNEEDFTSFYHYYHRHRRPHSWSEQPLPSLANS